MSARVKATLLAEKEFDTHRDAFTGIGLAKNDYVLSRLKEWGFARVDIPAVDLSRPPLHERLPGLVVAEPTGDKVGA